MGWLSKAKWPIINRMFPSVLNCHHIFVSEKIPDSSSGLFYSNILPTRHFQWKMWPGGEKKLLRLRGNEEKWKSAQEKKLGLENNSYEENYNIS